MNKIKTVINKYYFFELVIISIFSYIYFINSWVSDDAFISFRTIDNFINGYGLRWNIAERVQSFTNPLWILFLSPFYLIFKEIYFTNLFISFFSSLFSILLVLKKINSIRLKLFLFLILISSKAFIDYSSGGLENSLNYFLLILFYFQFLKILYKENKSILPKTYFLIILLSSLILFSRLDLILFIVVPLIYTFTRWKNFNGNKILWTVLGFTPIFIWLIFSTIYFGFSLPNTFYAKMNSIESFAFKFNGGLNYFKYSIKNDSITIIIILSSIYFFLKNLKTKQSILFSGIFLYSIYIFYTGGDFMGGRFFSYSVILSLLFIFIYYHERLIKRINYFFPLIILYLILFPNSTIYIPSKPSMSIKGIGDEKIVYHKTTSLVYNWKNKSGLNKEKTRILSNKDFLNKNIIITPIIGMTGYFLGPKIHILDPLALTDPLLARLPGKGRVGHKY
ncbi:MAG: hypothetical protein KDK36_16275, partial [Leptospiraceae bacterium]|nr:hypothetical protein [Leptospiraceae bacterium]